MPIDEAEVVARAKAELRKRLRALRQTTPASACAARSERIVARLLGMEVVTKARSIALFWPIEERHEVDLRPLDPPLRERGVAVAYPSVSDRGAREMTFRFATPAQLVDAGGGVHGAPASAEEARSLDVIVVPSIALDAQGKRLGYGAGFYDRALHRFTTATTIGVAYDFQLLAEVPSLAHDVAVRWVMTDTREINCGAPLP